MKTWMKLAPAQTELLPTGAARLPSPWAHAAHKPLFIAFLAVFAILWMAALLGISFSDDWRWVDGLFWLLAAATSVVGLARRLPEQNVFTSVFLIGGLALVIGVIGDKTGVPFGPRVYADAFGAKLFGVPFPVPVMWIVIIVSCRGVARLIMRPWRKTTYYGFWVIGLASVLSVLFDAGFEPFATRVKHYWFWETYGNVLNWYSTPWANFLGWFAVTLGIIGFTTPWLINKQPVKQPNDYHPLALWLLLNVYLATGNALQGLWLAVAICIAGNAIALIYAVRGARW